MYLCEYFIVLDISSDDNMPKIEIFTLFRLLFVSSYSDMAAASRICYY